MALPARTQDAGYDLPVGLNVNAHRPVTTGACTAHHDLFGTRMGIGRQING